MLGALHALNTFSPYNQLVKVDIIILNFQEKTKSTEAQKNWGKSPKMTKPISSRVIGI